MRVCGHACVWVCVCAGMRVRTGVGVHRYLQRQRDGGIRGPTPISAFGPLGCLEPVVPLGALRPVMPIGYPQGRGGSLGMGALDWDVRACGLQYGGLERKTTPRQYQAISNTYTDERHVRTYMHTHRLWYLGRAWVGSAPTAWTGSPQNESPALLRDDVLVISLTF